MLAVTEQLLRQRAQQRAAGAAREYSPFKLSSNGAPPASPQNRQNLTADGAANRPPDAPPVSAPPVTAGSGVPSVAAMQQRLQAKFGEEAAAFMLHDMQQVPEHLHVLFYTAILQLRDLPNPLPSTMAEAFHSVFSQHFDQTVGHAERRVAQYKTYMAQTAAQAANVTGTAQQKVEALSANGARMTPQLQQAQAQLQQVQRQVAQTLAAQTAELTSLTAAATAARTQHAQMMRLLCVAVAAQERLSCSQLAAMGLDGVLSALPAWEVLFHARDGYFAMVDPSLEAWLVDKRGAGQFACDPRVGHAALGQHYLRLVRAGAVRSLDVYGLRYGVLHLLLSEREAIGGERLLLDAEYMEQVFRAQQEGTLYLTLFRLASKTEVVSELLRWLRHNMGALRTHPRAVVPLWHTAPSRTMLARLVASGKTSARAGLASSSHTAGADTAADGAHGAHRNPHSQHHHRQHHLHPHNGGMMIEAGHTRAEEAQAPNGELSGGAGFGSASENGQAASPELSGAPSPTAAGLEAHAAGHSSPAAAVLGGPATTPAPRPQCVLLNPPPFWPVGITALPGHTGGVTGLVFDRRNRLLAAATAAGVVHMWDHATARRVGTMTGYSPSVPSADLHPSGTLLAVGSSTDCAVRIRGIDSGSGPLITFSEPQPESEAKALLGPRNATVRHLTYSPDGHLLAVVYGDGTVTVWDPVRAVRSSTLPVLNRAAAARFASFAPDGQLLALACANGTIRVWYLERLNPVHVSILRAYEPNVAVRCVYYSPSGLLLASVAEGSSEVVLWDVASGKQHQALAGPPGTPPVRALAFSPGGQLLAAAGDGGDVSLWNANTRGHWSRAAVLSGHAYAVNALAFSPCGTLLASGGNEDSVRLWDVGAALHRAEAHRADMGNFGQTPLPGSVPQSHGVMIRADEAAAGGRHAAPGILCCLAHNPAGTLLAAGMGDGAVCLWDTASPEQRWARLLGQHRQPVGRVLFSADGRLLMSASDDGCICIWDVAAAETVGGGPSSVQLVVAIQTDAALWARPEDEEDGLQDGAAITAASTTGVMSRAVARHRHGTGAGGWATLSCSVSISPDGCQLASAHDDGTVLLWMLPEGELAARLRGHAKLAAGLQYSVDGRLLASASDDGTVCIWDTEAAVRAAFEERRPEPVARLHHRDHVYGMDFAPDGSAIATISRDGNLCTWDPRAGLCAASVPHSHSTATKASVDGVRYSPTGLLLATGSSDEAIVRLWHAGSCTLLRELAGVRLLAWPGLAPAPWAAFVRMDYAPFVVRLPERSLLLEAAAALMVSPDGAELAAAAAADEAAEGLAGAAVGLPPVLQVGPGAHRRQEQLHRCRQLSLHARLDPATGQAVPVIAADAPALRPAVRIFSSASTVPHVSLRGRSLVLADSATLAIYSVDASAGL
ncbi:hypothetical protein GPECTOR_39g480 [Gonium pectorale]|uniref:TANC1/2-like winged helix domain-containing protein n=1 Tax=Gonium pectorale TaxID=33097 RepID=A0A150GAW5_GONPE|nr:hypothetical protein GPECTOR_39g480 [Gonium pectorale]|eukprot:KXZ46986.1 hypothetical protein GPECTOR_39g480 [Gonium pectorale]